VSVLERCLLSRAATRFGRALVVDAVSELSRSDAVRNRVEHYEQSLNLLEARLRPTLASTHP
jgi:hypothetical protein